MLATYTSTIYAAPGFRSTGCTNGVSATTGGMVNAQSATISGGSFGARTDYAGSIYVVGSTISGATYGVYAADGGYAKATGVNAAGTTTPFSPAITTFGNNGAYIAN